jgi:hypothetical protein
LVSPAIASIALRDAGYIDKATQEAWTGLETPALAARYGWSDQYRALQAESNRPRAPQRLLARAVQGYLEHVVSLQTLATLRGVNPQTVEDDLREAGLVPSAQPTPWADPADLPDLGVDLTGLEAPPEEPPG